jgi:DNA-binding NtrC family response regulator
MTAEITIEGKKILIVDDERDVRDTLEDLLSMCEVSQAESYDQAKALMEAQPFDIAILDIMGVDGFDLLSLANSHGITAVMLTAHALSPENVIKSFDEGAASYLPKEEMSRIEVFLTDILEAKAKGRHPWWRWYGRLSSFCDRTFGPDWKGKKSDILDRIPFY